MLLLAGGWALLALPDAPLALAPVLVLPGPLLAALRRRTLTVPARTRPAGP
jgi:hypothetical protein